jgi:hypothetical protein
VAARDDGGVAEAGGFRNNWIQDVILKQSSIKQQSG